MKHIALLVVVLVCTSYSVQASPGHQGAEATPVTLYVHLGEGGQGAVSIYEPTGHVLDEATLDAPSCNTSLQWLSTFTSVPAPEAGWSSQGESLDRDAIFDGNLRLTWFIETVRPGTSEPLDTPLPPLRLTAALRTGTQGEDLGNGTPLTTGEATEAVAADVSERHVYQFTADLLWLQNSTIPAADAFHLDVRLDSPLESCPVAPIGIRAYADNATTPRLEGRVFDALRIDRYERLCCNQTTLNIVLHASSPWGSHDLQIPTLTVTGQDGARNLAPLSAGPNNGFYSAQWYQEHPDLTSGRYRADASIHNHASTATAAASMVFEIEASPIQAEFEPDAVVREQESPAGVESLLGLMLAGMLVLRRRR